MGLAEGSIRPRTKGIYQVRASHTAGAVSVTFDEPNLVSHAGLVPLLRLAQRAGLHDACPGRNPVTGSELGFRRRGGTR